MSLPSIPIPIPTPTPLPNYDWVDVSLVRTIKLMHHRRTASTAAVSGKTNRGPETGDRGPLTEPASI